MKDIADTSPTKRARKRRARRRPRMHWGRLVVCIVIFAVIAVVGLVSGTIVAVSHNLPNIDAMKRQQLGQDTVIFDRKGNRIAELYGAVNRVVVPSHADPRGHEERHRGHRRQALLPASRRRLHRHRPRPGRRRQGRPRRRRAPAPSPSSTSRTPTSATTPPSTRKLQRGGARLGARGPLVQRQDPHRVPEHRVLRRRRLRRAGRLAHLLPQAGLQADPAQAALLAALPKFPSEYSPITDPQVITERRNLVLDGMAQQGYITVAQATAAKAVKLRVYAKPPSQDQSTRRPTSSTTSPGSSSTATARARSSRAACASTPRSTCPCRTTPSPRSRRSCRPPARPAPSWRSTRPTATSAS